MTYVDKVALAFVAVCLVVLNSTSEAGTEIPDGKINSEVKDAREMLDSWSGQSQTLDQARDKLARVLTATPQDYYALKEMARYQIMAGYINSRFVQSETHVYEIGNYRPGTLETAEATIRSAIRINPRFAEGYVLLGHIQTQQTKLGDAAKSLAEAEALGTEDPWLQLNWAVLDNARGDYSAARARAERVLQSGTSNVKARLVAYDFLIASYKRSGDHNKVVSLYEDQVELNPTNAWLRGAFAEYLTDTLGRNDEAIVQARLALKIMDYGVGERILAMALYRKWADLVALGNAAEGERYFQKASAIYPQLNEVMAYGASVPAGERLARALMAQKGLSIDARVDDGSTAILIATNRNRVETVQMLLGLNANPNISDNVGWTPLLSAADEGNTAIVILLLGKGADNRATLHGSDAAALAQRRGKADLAALLRQRAEELK